MELRFPSRVRRSSRVATSSSHERDPRSFYGFDMERMLKGLMAELLFGNLGAKTPTCVRNDNSTVAYQVNSVNAVTGENDLVISWKVIWGGIM